MDVTYTRHILFEENKWYVDSTYQVEGYEDCVYILEDSGTYSTAHRFNHTNNHNGYKFKEYFYTVDEVRELEIDKIIDR
tara:strand:+ start:588 stop:824 length:237 start_codon:yes stop_codon:yes gene_type:complete